MLLNLRASWLLTALTLCACNLDTPTDFKLSLHWGGHTRTAYVHLPDAHDGALPVIFNFHGYESNAHQQASYSRMNDKAGPRGFAVVHPDGLHNSWNAGPCCGRAKSQGVDDVGFVDALLVELEKHITVDKKRVFATGMSNGGFMSYRLACERSLVFAAIAPVAAANGMENCKVERAVPLLHFHGTKDSLVDYDGKGPYGFPGARDSVEHWPGRLGCTLDFTQTFSNGDARCETYAACNGGEEATLCTIEGGGHTWPGAAWFPGLGRVTKDLDATDRVLDFFDAHPMP